jgi:hypothetical protein
MSVMGHAARALAAALMCAGVVGARAAAAAPFLPGDVFTSINYGRVQHWNGDGVLLDTLDAGGSSFWAIALAGCAFDAAGNLYAGWNNKEVRRMSGPLDPHVITPWGIRGVEPSLIEFDQAGNAYVSAGRFIIRHNALGSPDGAFVLEGNLVVGLDLAPDDCTLFYTALLDAAVHRFDVCRNEALPDFSSKTTTPAVELALTVRLLGDGGALLTTGADIVRLDAGGRMVQSYDAPDTDGWMPLGLDPNGSSFWAGDAYSGRFYRFDIGSGVVERGPFETGAGHSLGRDFTALCVFGAESPTPSWTTTIATSTTTTTLSGATANRVPDCSTAVADQLRRRKGGRLVPVRIRGVTDPEGTRVRVHVTAVREDGPVTRAACPGPRVVGKRIAWLRTARAGEGNERTYRLWFRAKDRRGGVCRGSLQVCVPAPGRPACIASARVESASPCP